jgi:hypothetical protein
MRCRRLPLMRVLKDRVLLPQILSFPKVTLL